MIKVNNLWKIYDTGKIQVNALNDVSFHIETGDFVAIIGASGSGKSTLMNILGCLDRPTKGFYELDKVAVEGLDDEALATIRNEKIGFVFQSFNLLSRTTALQNVELPMIYGKYKKKERMEKAEEALKKVGLEDRMDHNPNELSGGQKQRVAIARALATEPSIILADEPTGNLDSLSTEEVMKIFEKLNDEGATIVLVTHEDDIAERAKRVLTFKDGEIISDVRQKSLNAKFNEEGEG